jgi:HEAT repeat protein
MTEFVFDEYNMRDLTPKKRLEKIEQILKSDNEQDESKRWDCVWLAGEMCETVPRHEHKFHKQIADLMVWIMNNDNNSIVRHEAAFQIGLHNIRDRIPDLLNSIVNDESELVKHEAIEALGLLRVHSDDSTHVLKLMMKDKSPAVRDTATFVLKRLERLKDRGEYKGEAIL